MVGTVQAPRIRLPQLARGLANACHPAPTLAVTTVAILLAAGVGLTAGRIALLGAAVFTGQLSIGWSNDGIDASRDASTGRSDKPVASGRVPLSVVAGASALALLTTAVLSALLGPPAAAAALTLVAAGWAYNLGLKATVLSGAAYLVGFGALPAVPYLASPGHPWPPWWVPVTGALLGFGAHFANALPDLRADAATGVRGLPQRLGTRAGVVVMAVTLAAASIVLGFGPGSTSLAVACAAAAVGVAGAAGATVAVTRAPESPAAFRITLLIALLDVALLIAIAA
jgi:4-hydroxybenzoate polyprenyltransferase